MLCNVRNVANIHANVNKLYSVRGKFARNDTIAQENYRKVRPFKWLRMFPNFLRIPANYLRSLRSVCRISCESFANVKNTYECLTITTNALPSIRISCDAYENVTKTIKNMVS